LETDLKFIRLVSGIEEAERELGEVLGALGVKRGALVVDPNVVPMVRKTLDFLLRILTESPMFHPETNLESEVDGIIEGLGDRSTDIVLGIGGGRTIDVAKMTARRLDVNVISFPTLVSHDGIASPVAVLLDADGKKRSLPARMPVAVLVDLEIIGRAPIASIRAGVGDLISNFSALEDWKLGALKTGEKFHDLAAVISHSAACSTFEMSEVGDTYPRHPDFIRRLVEGLILSGVAMSIAGSSRPASGGEHNISHSIDALYDLNAYHGEQVALCTVMAMCLRGGSWEKFLQFFQHIGLPVTSLDIGLSEKDYINAILQAPHTRTGRYTVLDEIDLNEELVKNALAQIKRRLTG